MAALPPWEKRGAQGAPWTETAPLYSILNGLAMLIL